MAKVLIADDAAFMRMKSANLVKELGHEVVEAADGAEAVAMYKQHRPDAVLPAWPAVGPPVSVCTTMRLRPGVRPIRSGRPRGNGGAGRAAGSRAGKTVSSGRSYPLRLRLRGYGQEAQASGAHSPAGRQIPDIAGWPVRFAC